MALSLERGEAVAGLTASEPTLAEGLEGGVTASGYARARAADVLAMDATVHGLYRLFASGAQPIARLRNAGLNLTDRLPVLKNLLMRQAMT